MPNGSGPRRRAGAAERTSLLMKGLVKTGPGVQIPPSPPFSLVRFAFQRYRIRALCSSTRLVHPVRRDLDIRSVSARRPLRAGIGSVCGKNSDRNPALNNSRVVASVATPDAHTRTLAEWYLPRNSLDTLPVSTTDSGPTAQQSSHARYQTLSIGCCATGGSASVAG